MYIEKNIGNIERVIRLFVGISILYLVFYKIIKGWWSFWITIVAIYEMISAAVGYCFMYDLFNWSPLKSKIDNNQSESSCEKVPQQ